MAAAGGSNTFAGGLANLPYYVILTDGAGNVISPATGTNQTSGAQKTQIVDGFGNVVGAINNGLFPVQQNFTSLGNQAWTGIQLGGGATAGQVDISSVGGTAVTGTSVPISATSLPLPTGAASAANQATEITALQTLAGCVQATNLLYTFNYGVRNIGAVVGSIFFDGAAGISVLNVGGVGQGQTGVNPSGSIYAGHVAPISQYPAGATPVVGAGTGTTGAVTATLPGTAGKTTYICGFTIMAAATSLATGTATVAGLVGSVTFTYDQTVAAAANGTSKLTEAFAPGIPASAANTPIVVTSAAAGLGGVTDVNVWGYQL